MSTLEYISSWSSVVVAVVVSLIGIGVALKEIRKDKNSREAAADKAADRLVALYEGELKAVRTRMDNIQIENIRILEALTALQTKYTDLEKEYKALEKENTQKTADIEALQAAVKTQNARLLEYERFVVRMGFEPLRFEHDDAVHGAIGNVTVAELRKEIAARKKPIIQAESIEVDRIDVRREDAKETSGDQAG
ncbi:MAG: hypothetical protein M3P51_06805 [Chloroflexota bacterium]|nr:hypothetical protein [Chloroflexota bacterium]